MKVFIHPSFKGKDKGDGGVRRVVEAQRRHLPDYGIEVVDHVDQAELVAAHILVDKPIMRSPAEVPFVLHNHGLYWAEYDWEEGVQPKFADWCAKANAECLKALRMADAVTAPSEWVAQALRRGSLRQIVPIGHGVDMKDWPAPTSAKRSSNYALWNKTRPDPICDPDPLNQLARRAPDTEFVSTFGDEDLPNVKLTGRVSYEKAKEYIRKAGVYLCTSRETFGIGTIEAMAAGVPVLGWNWGGQADIVEHKVTGWLSPPGNYDDLLAGLRFCLKHRTRMGRAARKVVQQSYQWKDVVGAYAQLYARVIEEAQREQPKVSIIVPAYNLEQYLTEALESVRTQTEQDWECVVVDDASPDGCGKIADNYAELDSRFRVIHNEENQYLAGALNTGVAAAIGRYVLPLDADNLLPRRAVEFLANALDADRTLHIAYGNVEFLDADGRRWHSGWPPEFKAESQVMKMTDDDQRPQNLIPSTSLYRRRVWDLTGGYRRRHRTAEDADFWTRATSYGFIARRVTEADTLTYRNRSESMSRNEPLTDWTRWLPWSRKLAPPPFAVNFDGEVLVPSYEPLLVSIIIPVGPGHEELVIDALDSVDAQTFRLWECIVVNDTGQPLRFVPSWARLIETPGKVGVAAARNLGILAAKAKLFLPLDADDTLEIDALAALFETHQEVGGVVYSDWYEKWDGRELQVWNTPEYDAHDLLKRGCIHAVTALYARSDWEKVGGFDAALPAWEDWDFQLKLAEIGVCGTRVPRPLFTYRKDAGMRREDNYAHFEQNKEQLREKWAPYFEGGKELMACTGCAKKAARKAPIQASPTMGPPAPASPRSAPRNGGGPAEYVIIEYVGRKLGTLNYQGPSGTRYRFSASPTERRKYVATADADYFLGKVDFREGQAE